ncbi:MAG TPA: hypothetical protein VGA70_06505 [Longimicrobiales bacterium]
MRLPLLVALILLWPGGDLRAQGGSADDGAPSGVIQAFVHGGLRVTSVAGEVGVMAGGAAGLSLSDRIYVGGGGWMLLRDSDIGGAGVYQSRALGVGYGGVMVDVTLADPGSKRTVAVRALLGVGNLDIRDPITGIRIDSSNFVVMEPEAVARVGLGRRMAIEGTLSYRAVFGLDALSGLDDGDVGGPGFSVLLRVGPLS